MQRYEESFSPPDCKRNRASRNVLRSGPCLVQRAVRHKSTHETQEYSYPGALLTGSIGCRARRANRIEKEFLQAISFSAPERVGHTDTEPGPALAFIREVCSQKINVCTGCPVRRDGEVRATAQHPRKRVVRGGDARLTGLIKLGAQVRNPELRFSEETHRVLVHLSVPEKDARPKQPILQVSVGRNQAD